MPAARFYFVDVGRIVAIWGIVIMHYFEPAAVSKAVAIPLQFAGAGVYLFFFLSGFLLPLTGHDNWLAFYKKRFLKIIIPYYVLVTFVFILGQFGPPTACSSVYAYCGKIFFYAAFDVTIFACYGFPLWFIGTLIQLYLIYPALSVLLDRFGKNPFALGSVMISVGWVILLIALGKSEIHTWKSFFPTYLWVFAFGMVAAKIYQEKNICLWDAGLKKTALLLILSIAAVFMLEYAIPQWSRKINDPFTAVAYFSVILILFRLVKSSEIIRNAASRFAPDQYYIYLLHIIPPLLVSRYVMKSGTKYDIYTSMAMLLTLILLYAIFIAIRGFSRNLHIRRSTAI